MKYSTLIAANAVREISGLPGTENLITNSRVKFVRTAHSLEVQKTERVVFVGGTDAEICRALRNHTFSSLSLSLEIQFSAAG